MTGSLYRCRACNAEHESWANPCQACGMTRGMDRLRASTPHDTKEPTTLAHIQPTPGRRIATGIRGLDRVLGTDVRTGKSGLHVPSVVLFSGAPGCGKSTLLLRMLAHMASRSTLYLSTEQPLEEIRANADRLRLGERIKRIRASYTQDVDDAFRQIKAMNPRVVVVDSLNRLHDPHRDSRDRMANALHVANRFKYDAEEHDRATVLIAHMNKQEQVGGLLALQHDVSTVMVLTKAGRRLRRLSCPEKNRFGDTAEQAFFEMRTDGLHEVDAPAEAEGSLGASL